MPEQTNIQRTLINVDDSVLIVIDVQPPFLDKLPREESQLLRNRICWLIGVAGWLHVPLFVTAEDMAHEGGVDPQVVRAIPAGVHVHNKMVFDLAADPAITHVFAVQCETTSGVLNPIDAIAKLCARLGKRLLVDALSAFGALPLDVAGTPIDAVAASSN